MLAVLRQKGTRGCGQFLHFSRVNALVKVGLTEKANELSVGRREKHSLRSFTPGILCFLSVYVVRLSVRSLLCLSFMLFYS